MVNMQTGVSGISLINTNYCCALIGAQGIATLISSGAEKQIKKALERIAHEAVPDAAVTGWKDMMANLYMDVEHPGFVEGMANHPVRLLEALANAREQAKGDTHLDRAKASKERGASEERGV